MVSAFALSQARTIVHYAPELADRVLAVGGMTFAEAFEKARQRKAEAETNAEKMARLRTEAPDRVCRSVAAADKKEADLSAGFSRGRR